MALFRKAREIRAGVKKAIEERAEAKKAKKGSQSGTERLEETLNEIGEQVAAPDEALEPALQAIVEAAGAAAGAICLYDVRQSLMRLTVEVGLSDEGCAHLRTVRRADPGCWDMPLHGLLNRRAYLIERASENRYVPQLVQAKTPVSTVMCLPLYGGMTALGSLILVSAGTRTFQQRDIKLLWPSVRILARMIEEVRRRALKLVEPVQSRQPLEHALSVQTTLTAARNRLKAELESRQAEIEQLQRAAEKQQARLEQLQAELASSTAERDTLRANLEARPQFGATDAEASARLAAVESERERLQQSLSESERLRAELEQREAGLEAAREEAERRAQTALGEATRAQRELAEQTRESERVVREKETELGQLRTRVEKMDSASAVAQERLDEVTKLSSELEATHGREAQLREALAEAKAARSGEHEHAVQTALESVRSAELAREEAEHAAALVRDELASAMARVESTEGELATLREEAEKARAEAQRESAERARLESTLQELNTHGSDTAARISQLDEELTVVRAERDTARHTNEELQSEVASLTVMVETISAKRDQLSAEVEGAKAGARANDDLEKALRTEREARSGLSAEMQRLRAELDATKAAAAEAASGSELEQLRAQHQALMDERDQLRSERDVALEKLAASEIQGVSMVELDAEPIPDPATELDDEDLTVISVPPEPAVVPARASEDPVLVVLDTSETWKDLEIEGHEMFVMSPELDTSSAIVALEPERIIANLGAGVINSLSALRKAGCTAQMWGCIADPESGRGLPLGVIEPVIPPLDPDAVIDKLGPYVVKGSRIVTVGADVDALMSLRQALARRSTSVSMAWDANQAIDIIRQSEPDALVVDLDLPKSDGYTIVTEAIPGLDRIPYTLLVGGRTKSGEAFTAALRRSGSNDSQLPLQKLLKVMVSSVERIPTLTRKRPPKPVPFGAHGGHLG